MQVDVTKNTFIMFNSLYIVLLPLLNYLNLDIETVAILGVLLIIDFLTGTIKALVIKGDLRSYRAIAGILTKGSILFLVFTLALMAKALDLNFIAYLNLFVSALIISETYSIFGNAYSAITKQEVEEIDAVAIVIKKVRAAIIGFLFPNRENL